MKILVWCPHHVSTGGARVLVNLVAAIARQDDVQLISVVIAPHIKFRERFNWSEYQNVNIIYHDGDIHSFGDRNIFHDHDIVYFNWPHIQRFVNTGRPSVCTFQDTIVFDLAPMLISLQPSFQRDLIQYRAAVQEWMHGTTVVVSPCHYVKSRLCTYFGPVCDAGEVIPYAVSPATAFSSDQPPVSTLQLPDEYFVYPTNTAPHKNILNLLLAYAQFNDRKKYPLVLFGHGTEAIRELYDHPYLKSTLRLNEDFYALGIIPDQEVVSVIKNAKALIMASLGEGTGLPAYEALGLGTPVLCSDIPVMRELLANRSAKINWFNPYSPESILESINLFIENYQEYKQSAVQGMNDPVEGWDDVAKKYMAIFSKAYLKFWGHV